ncbi:MAG TPA: GntR family transcriptional regulator [Gemmatimonadaceae bacterium]
MTGLDVAPIRDLARLHVLDKVIAGLLPSGKIISPVDLASDLGVSPTPVREAFIELVRDGFLENIPRRGFAVRRLAAKEAAELYPIGWTLEGLAIRSTPPKQATLDRLDAINAKMAEAQAPLEIHRLDCEWHDTVVSDYSGDTLRELLSIVRNRLRRYEAAYFRHGGTVPASVDQHAAIARFLRRGEVAPALEALRANWMIGLPLLSAWLDSRESDQDPGSA